MEVTLLAMTPQFFLLSCVSNVWFADVPDGAAEKRVPS